VLPKCFRCRGEGCYSQGRGCLLGNFVVSPPKTDLGIQRAISERAAVSASIWYLESREDKLTSSQIFSSSGEISTVSMGSVVVLCSFGTAGNGELNS